MHLFKRLLQEILENIYTIVKKKQQFMLRNLK